MFNMVLAELKSGIKMMYSQKALIPTTFSFIILTILFSIFKMGLVSEDIEILITGNPLFLLFLGVSTVYFL
ncbi:MAG: hypothetical protein GY870_03700, partial [archaeon]|nr:hypothetical protein [archaeon]